MMAPVPVVAPAPRPVPPPPVVEPARTLPVLAAGQIRRCVYRHVDVAEATSRQGAVQYAIDCGHPSLESPLALGDLADARPICNTCMLPGIFRADED